MRKHRFLSIGVAAVFLALTFAAVITPQSAQAQRRNYGYGDATATSTNGSTGAVTLNQDSGTVTTNTTATTAAGADYTMTVTCDRVAGAKAIVGVWVAGGGTNTTAGLSVHEVTPGTGSFTIAFRNTHATAALNGSFKFKFVVFYTGG